MTPQCSSFCAPSERRCIITADGKCDVLMPLYCIQPNSACRCHDCAQALADFIVYLHESPKPWRLPKAVPSVVGLAMPDAKTETQLRLPA